jgi:F-type H+-transporting ATPase subunit a
MDLTLFASPISHLLAAGSDPLKHVVDHPLVTHSTGWWILSNHVVMLVLAAVVCVAIFLPLSAKYRTGELVPTGSRNFFEAILLYLRNDVAKPLLGQYTDFYMPLLWTIFFYIWTINLLGLVPLDLITGKVLGLGHEGHGIYGTPTSSIYVTGTLALVTFVVVQATGILRNGIGGWAHHFLGGAPWWLGAIMVPVELLGTLIKPFSLAIRLFANMTAGHLLLAVLLSFTATVGMAYGYVGSLGIALVVIPAGVAIMCLELFVATLQAFLFMFLSALFISQMLPHHHDDHDSDHAGADGHAAAPAKAGH